MAMRIMSSHKGPIWIFTGLCALTGLARSAAAQAQNAALSCPAVVDTAESIRPPAGWDTRPATAQHKFTATEKGRTTQRWNLTAYRSMDLNLTCRYAGTTLVLTKKLPAPLRSCTLRFSLDSKGRFIGQSEMDCR
jgi:hypothetical protein